VKIEPELASLIPPLSSAELARLEANIKSEGCRDALVVWRERGVLLDGHNRHEICTRLGIPYRIEEVSCPDISAAKIWIIDNQKGRRNLSDGWKFELAQTKKAILAERGREHQKLSEGRGKKGLSKVDKPFEPHNTQKEIAAELGWSTGKVAMADKVWKDAAPEVKEQIKSGELSINQAFTVLKKLSDLKDRKADYETKRTATEVDPVIVRADALTWLAAQGECALLLTDPPFMTDVPDIRAFAAEWLPLALSKVKPTGRAYVFIGAYPEELAAYMSIAMPTQVLVWTYRNTIGPCAKTRYNLNWQAILYYCGSAAGPLRGECLTDRWAVQDVNAPDGRQGNRIHKWQKPDLLAERIITQATEPGNVVFDPFCGSGTFLLAAGRLGRKGFGCDKEWRQ